MNWYLDKGGLGDDVSVWEWDGGASTYHDLMTTPSDTNWHHYLWIISGGSISFFFDGGYITTLAGFNTTTFFETGDLVAVGSRYDGLSSVTANANIADLRIFDIVNNHELSSDDIAWLSDASNVGVPLSPPLYIDGIGTYNRSGFLYVEGHKNLLNAYTPLFTFGTTVSELYSFNTMSLYMGPPEYSDSMYLYIHNTQDEVPYSAGRPLYIGGESTPLSGSISLYTKLEETSLDTMSLFVRGDGVFPGYTPDSEGKTLYMKMEDAILIERTLYVDGAGIPNAFIPLYMQGHMTLGSGIVSVGGEIITVGGTGMTINPTFISLVIPNVESQLLNGTMTLVVPRHEVEATTPPDTTLFIHGYGVFNGVAPLVVNPNSGETNTYTSLFIDGAYVVTEEMTLTIPVVADDTPNSPITLFVFGW